VCSWLASGGDKTRSRTARAAFGKTIRRVRRGMLERLRAPALATRRATAGPLYEHATIWRGSRRQPWDFGTPSITRHAVSFSSALWLPASCVGAHSRRRLAPHTRGRPRVVIRMLVGLQPCAGTLASLPRAPFAGGIRRIVRHPWRAPHVVTGTRDQTSVHLLSIVVRATASGDPDVLPQSLARDAFQTTKLPLPNADSADDAGRTGGINGWRLGPYGLCSCW